MTVTDRGSPEAASATITDHGNRVIVGGVLVLIGLLWITERAGWTNLSATAVLAIAALTIGVALMIRARDGEHPGLIVVGIILTTLTGFTAAAPFEGFQGGFGDRTVEVSNLSELDADYELGAGSLVIDLSELDWDDDLGTITVNVGVGEVRILVPDGADIDARARAGAGRVAILDDGNEGLFVEQNLRSPGFESGSRRVTIEANVLIGTVEVMQP